MATSKSAKVTVKFLDEFADAWNRHESQHRLRMIHLVADAQRQARIRARLGDDAVERGRSSTGQENVCFIGEFPPGNSAVGGKAMSLRERHDQSLRQQGLRHQRRAMNGRPQDPDINPAILQGYDLLRRRQAVQFDLDVGMALAESADDLGPAREISPWGAANE